MKRLLVWFVCFLPLMVQAQVKLQAEAKRIGEGIYRLNLHIAVASGYHLYAANARQDIEGPVVQVINAKGKPVVLSGAVQSLKDPVFDNQTVNVFAGKAELTSDVVIEGPVPAELALRFSGFVSNGQEFVAVEEKFSVALDGGMTLASTGLKIPSIDVAHPRYGSGPATEAKHSALAVFLLGLVGGLLALLTPCVFPMIPVTVSFFTSKSSSRGEGIRNGVLYGVFILAIYLSASLPFHLAGNVRPELLNNIATSAPLNLLFFVVFVVFAISFFGAFELSLPSSVATRAGNKGGIFFMALTLCIVSFSCTGPILGSLLVGSLSGGAWLLTAGLAGFGVALGLPFGLFAVFPQALQKLPRSGTWMVTVKKILAFIELALAFKFLSNADLVMHWGLLKREVFIAIWIVISLVMMGWLLLRGRLVLGVISFVISIYLCTGLFGGSLSALSGFPPPASYSLFASGRQKLEADVMNDYQKALALARQQHKKLLIDFTGWACVNCRKMEEHIWTDPAVASYIREKFVLVSLYVDDKKPLPEHERSDSVRTIGDRLARFEVLNFGQTSQPLYAVLDSSEQLVTPPQGYQPNAEKFLTWLKKSEGP